MSQTYFLPQKRVKSVKSLSSSSSEEEYKPLKLAPNLLPKAPQRPVLAAKKRFAGDPTDKLLEVFEYLHTGQYPKSFEKIKDYEKLDEKKKKFWLRTQSYFLSKEYLCDVSQSRFCVKDEKDGRVVPYLEETDQILQGLHVVDGVHLGKGKSVERAVELKVFWQGYSNEVERFIKACFCECAEKSEIRKNKKKKSGEEGLLKMKIKKKMNKKEEKGKVSKKSKSK